MGQALDSSEYKWSLLRERVECVSQSAKCRAAATTPQMAQRLTGLPALARIGREVLRIFIYIYIYINYNKLNNYSSSKDAQ